MERTLSCAVTRFRVPQSQPFPCADIISGVEQSPALVISRTDDRKGAESVAAGDSLDRSYSLQHMTRPLGRQQ